MSEVKKVPVFLVRNVSKKDATKSYFAIIVELGYRQAFLSFNSNEIAEICGLALPDLYTLPIGSKKLLGSLDVSKILD